LVEPEQGSLSVRRQCELLGLARSTFYYAQAPESEDDLCLKRLIDEEYLRHPFFGSRSMTAYLRGLQHQVNRKHVQRLMRQMGIQAIYPKKTTVPAPGHKIYPYLLRGVKIERVNQVWSTDITYVPMQRGFMYLTAIMDWHSRYVLSWRVSNTMDTTFCLEALEEALGRGPAPEIFNTDQGSQFTSEAFTGRLEAAGIAISMDGRGRALDNVFIERLWRSVKYEDIYLKEYATAAELIHGLSEYFTFYDEKRFHQSLAMRTPGEVYREGLAAGAVPR
jgi:putative transposase